jgi:long-chain fatty acid transport protein
VPRETDRPRLALGCLAVAGVLATGDAKASPAFDLTGGTDGLGGLQAGTIEGGASAAYFNPSLLVDLPFGLTLGFLAVSTQIGVSLDARPGTQFDVPDGVANATHASGAPIGNVPIPTNLLQNGRPATALNPALAARPRQGAGTGHQTTAYESVGFVAKLLDNRLALGFYGLIPDGNFTNLNAFYSDEREQYFSNSLHPELYGDRLTSLSLGFGAGYKISDALAVGLGASLILRAGVGAPTFVANAGALQNLLIDTNASVNVSVSPNLGVSYRPFPRLRLTGTVHAPEKVELGVDFTFLLPNGVEQGSSFSLVYDYMPWQIGTGAAYDIVQRKDETLTVAGTAVYGKWSDYVDRHGEAPIAAYGWYDTLTPTVGVRYRYRSTGTFLDVQYKPSPVPLQTGRSDYVDNDRLGGDVGVDYAFSFAHTSMRVGAQALVYWLVPRHQTKLPTPNEPDGLNHYPALVADELPDDSQIAGEPIAGSQGLQTNNPGWPGFGSAGAVLGGGVYLTVTP